MEPGWSYQEIQSVLKRKLAVQANRDPETGTELRCMLSMESGFESPTTPFGILLSRPELPLFAEQIAPHLNYLHHASGEHIDFFCAGYGRNWVPGEPPYQDARKVQAITHTGWPSESWFFSDEAFVKLVRELQSVSKWVYNGESVLLILSSKLRRSGVIDIDFSQTIAIPLEDAIGQKAIKSVHGFIQSIIRMAETNKGTWDMSDKLGVKSLGSSILNELIERDPTGVGKAAKKASHFAVHDYSIK